MDIDDDYAEVLKNIKNNINLYFCEPTPMNTPVRTVAEILKLTERSPHYLPVIGMCRALSVLHINGVITLDERVRCVTAINRYIERELAADDVYLFSALETAGLEASDSACRAIYRDWDNRPIPNKR